MKIIEVVEKQGKEKPYWNITIEGGPSKYANWFDAPAPVVGQTEFEMVMGKAYVDKQGKNRNYWNAKPKSLGADMGAIMDRLEKLERRVLLLEENSQEPTALANSQYRDSQPDESMPDDDTF